LKINFRQGIVRYKSIVNGSAWLQISSLDNLKVDINVGQEPVILTFAHYGNNYLIEETRSVAGAWGPFPNNTTQYLYWDVDLGTGALTRGWTPIPPIISGTEPINPLSDAHWFDTINTRMRVFKKPNASPGSWQDKVRLFAGVWGSIPQSYIENNNLIGTTSGPLNFYGLGTQVAIVGPSDHGNIILGSNNKPLKQSDGTFATTESELIIQQTSGQNVKFDMALVYAQAEEELPKYSLISFRPWHRIALASCTNLYSFVSGMVIADHHQEEMAQVITNGVVRNEQWDFQDAEINKPIFCGPAGEITLIPPTPTPSLTVAGTFDPVVVQQVGFVYERDSIYMNLFPPVRTR
jgi:hypothetical protein